MYQIHGLILDVEHSEARKYELDASGSSFSELLEAAVITEYKNGRVIRSYPLDLAAPGVYLEAAGVIRDATQMLACV